MPSFPEQSAVYPTTPDKLLEAFKRLDTLLPNLIPSVFSKAHKLQGDGGAGTIAEYVYTPGRTLKVTTELFDEVGHIFHADFQLEGDWRYSCFKVHIQLVPGLLHGTTRVRYTFIYEPETAPPPLDIIAAAHPGVVALSAYLYDEHEFQRSLSASTESTKNLTETV
ncbi:hypothetical protein M758_7G175800 [Ceratodon purpureus]|uniref:Bet v I/Major latex protein domain-containing protein n=1 Tax=Ceratodon purpureus TaxID=3225 RepID=A0A8T0HG83_CERPU|nr:hypothetical protein KC19_7G178700 [Ceratodon purpureus]KAG0611913.1 hypothetical protein M758_7G175800 [Ceratodon purpureus]